MIHTRPYRAVAACVLAVLLLTPACSALSNLAALREVDFAIDRLDRVELAGVQLDAVRSYRDLSAGDVLRLTRAVADRELPLAFDLMLDAENPSENTVVARLVSLDWTLFLEDTETVSGVFTDDIVLPPGRTRGIAIPIELDLLRFFDRSAPDLVELALALAGQGGASKEVRLQARPTISTPLGPMRYPSEITIVRREVGR